MQENENKKGGSRSENGGAIETAYRTKRQVGPVVNKEGGQLLLLPLTTYEQKQHYIMLQKIKISNRHQISQTKILFWLDFHADHESKLRFHSECLYKEKSENKVLTQKIKLKKTVN